MADKPYVLDDTTKFIARLADGGVLDAAVDDHSNVLTNVNGEVLVNTLGNTMTEQDIVVATVDPNTAPAFIGQLWVNTTDDTTWFGSEDGSASSSDWIQMT